MASADPIPQTALENVALQLGQLMDFSLAARPLPSARRITAKKPPRSRQGAKPQAAGAGSLGKVSEPELSESLAVCFVSAEQVKNPPKDLSVLARPSGIWHHQVRTEAGSTHIARSRQQGLGSMELQVEQWLESPIAGKLDDAISWVDQSIPDNRATVRLLFIPAYYVHALLIIRGDKYSAVLVDQPAGFKQLEYQKEYPLGKFLNRLSKEKMGSTLT